MCDRCHEYALNGELIRGNIRHARSAPRISAPIALDPAIHSSHQPRSPVHEILALIRRWASVDGSGSNWSTSAPSGAIGRAPYFRGQPFETAPEMNLLTPF